MCTDIELVYETDAVTSKGNTQKSWKNLGKEFNQIYSDYYNKIGAKATLYPLIPMLIKLYHLFHTAIISRTIVTSNIKLDVRFEQEPCVILSAANLKKCNLEIEDLKNNCYAYYSLCLIAELAREGLIVASNRDLLNFHLPTLKDSPHSVGWSMVHSDSYLKEKPSDYDIEFIFDLCQVAERLCKWIIDNRQFKESEKIPDGYVASTEICYNGEQIRASTINGWVKQGIRDKRITEEDIITSKTWGRKKYYPKWFIDEKLKTYEPRNQPS